MATESTALQMMGRAFWNPTPTTSSDRRARQLAAALGYPLGWRVVRSVVERSSQKSTNGEPATVAASGKLLVDRIYAGKPSTNCDAWFHHEAALKAAAAWHNVNEDEPPCTPFSTGGGHLLPRTALYSKQQKVQVKYQDEWWDAKILRCSNSSKKGETSFRYQVQYTADRTKQSGVDESHIRLPKNNNSGGSKSATDGNPSALAVSQGFSDVWQAFQNGSRWKVIAPDGTVFHSKKAALQAYAASSGSNNNNNNGDAEDDDDLNAHDPPWRRSGHDWMGRLVLHTTEYKVSSRRSVTLDQVGTIVGWLDGRTDVDRSGDPAHVNAATGDPGVVFRVRFPREPAHPYAAHLLTSASLEEDQVEPNLVAAKADSAKVGGKRGADGGQQSPKKKSRRG